MLLLLSLLGAALAQDPPPSGRLHGCIVDQRGEPVPGAEVFVTEQRLPAAVTRSDGSGTFLLAKVPFGDLELHARAEGFARSTCRVRVGADAALVACELMLADGGPLRGRVLGAGGKGIAGATVVATSSLARWLPVATATAKTDVDGRYAFDAVAFGEQEIAVLASGHEVGLGTCKVVGPTEHDIALRPGAPQALQVRLRGADAVLLANAECLLSLAAGNRLLEPLPQLRRGTFDARGDFVVSDLPSDLTFRESRVRVPGAAVRFVKAQQLGDRFVVDYECEPGPLQLLRGKVLGPDSEPRPGAELHCALPGGGRLRLVTDDAGAFAVPSPYCTGERFEIALADPALALRARIQDGVVVAASCSLRGTYDPARTHVLATTVAAQISGLVVDAGGNAAAGVRVALLAPLDRRGLERDLELATTHTDRNGRYRFGHVDPAIPSLQVRARGLRGDGESAAFAPAETKGDLPTVCLAEATGTVRGVLTGAGGEPIAGAIVCLCREGEVIARIAARSAWSHHTATDRDGRFCIARVPAGEFRLGMPGASSISSAKTSIEVEAGKVTTFDFRRQ